MRNYRPGREKGGGAGGGDYMNIRIKGFVTDSLYSMYMYINRVCASPKNLSTNAELSAFRDNL
jgi:hypothetical protein